MENLAQLEALCERLYNSQDSAERAHAESTLKCFFKNTDSISQCQYILDNALTPYALMLASSNLLKQVTKHRLPLQLRTDIRNYLMNYLARRGPDLESFVVGSVIQLFCQVTKSAWLDDDKFREVLVKEAGNFLNQAPCHYAIGLKMLIQLVSEMNQPYPGSLASYNRGVASSFRDQCLLQIFQTSLSSLFQVKDNVGSKLQELALSLSHKCLSFNFMGMICDECSDEIGNVQIPFSWRPVVEDPLTLKIFFDYYVITQNHFSEKALECLVLLASVRHSFFIGERTRSEFFTHIVTGTIEILQTEIGLADHCNYHLFCCLLGRLANHQLSELVNVEGYGDWMRLVAEFTLKSLRSWQWASDSVYYLLGLWSRLVTSVGYVKTHKPILIDEYIPKMIEGFVFSRFESVQSELLDELIENPLDNWESLQYQLEFFPHLCRSQYETCSKFIMKTMDPIMRVYMEGMNKSQFANSNELSVTEAKLAWMVHIVAAILNTKQILGSGGESQEILDAELSARVLQLISVTDSGFYSQRYDEVGKQRLDHAILTFFQHFRKSYIGEQASKLFERLSQLLCLHDHSLLLNVIAGKMVTNLKSYTECEEVLDHTLSLFEEMTSGFMTRKLLSKLDSIEFMLSHHNKEQFPFLEDHRCSRSRTRFYYTIGCLIFMEDSHLKFKISMDCLQQVFVSLEGTPDAMFRSDAVKYALIGLMRDLRGIVKATDSHKTYSFLFDWLYPAHMPVLIKGIAHWADTPEVTTPLLKFMAELVLNKSQRLIFDTSSPNGILLFREVSKLTVSYGARVLSFPNRSNIYAFKYKGIWTCWSMLTRALSGRYVNYGVFELYGDRALIDALDIAMKMAMSIPLADLLAYPKVVVAFVEENTISRVAFIREKLTKAYFALLVVLFKDRLSSILNMDQSCFMFIAESLEAGLKQSNVDILAQCACAVGCLATFYFNHITDVESITSAAALNLAQCIANLPDLFPKMLECLFEIVLFEGSVSLCDVGRPILSLILINEEMFISIKAQILASHLRDQQPELSRCFDRLKENISRSLNARNIDKFTQNLSRFRNEFHAR